MLGAFRRELARVSTPFVQDAGYRLSRTTCRAARCTDPLRSLYRPRPAADRAGVIGQLRLLAGDREVEYLGEALIGAQPLALVVNVRGDHDLVCGCVLGDLLDALPYGPRIADDLHRAVGIGQPAFCGRVGVGHRLIGARQLPRIPAAHTDPGQLHGRGGRPRLLAGLPADNGDREDGRGTFEALRGLEARAVSVHGGGRVRRAEMRGEGVAEAHLPGRPRRVAAGTQQPDRGQPDTVRHGDHSSVRMLFRKPIAREGEKLAEPLRKVIRLELVLRAAQRRGCHGVRARGAPYAEIYSSRMQRLQNAEGLRDLERGVVGEHDPASADPDPLRYVGDVPDHDLRRRTGYARQIVVLRQPVALVAEPVGEPGELERVAQRPGTIRARTDRRDVEDGEPEIHTA